jgi:nicotinate-nucleotide adenylyltransferase
LKYGILGGSFDPIHLGHVAAAEAARRERGLDRVLLIPAAKAPHKAPPEAAFEDRLAMARLAAEGREGLEVLDLEGVRGGISFTVDTVAELRRRWPDARLELLVGADMLLDLPTWRRARDLVREVSVVAFGRPGALPADARRRFEETFGEGLYQWLEIDPVAASSTEIRRRLAAGESVQGLLDPRVEAYIRERGLYGAPAPRGPRDSS